MSAPEQDAESADVAATTAVGPAEVAATVEIETPTEPVTTQTLTGEQPPGTLLLTTPADLSQDSVPPEYRRVGPGVPAAPDAPGTSPGSSSIHPATAAAWYGIGRRKPRRAPGRGWLLPLAVLVGVVVLLLWRQVGSPLAVHGVTAAAATPSIGCDAVETVTATVRTDGGAGMIVYRWLRNDGTVSDELRQSVGEGTKQIDVVLRWAFSGHGRMHALATIDVESPGTASAVASFVYSCP